jgi:hypothetical protein
VSAPPASRSVDVTMMSLGTLLTAVVLLGSAFLASNPGDALVRNSIRLSLAWYAIALGLMIQLVAGDWSARTMAGRLARWCWTWGWLVYVIHVGLAFHFVHHWSHAEAFEHVRKESGFGPGIFVSYLFTAAWTADAALWWLAPDRYSARSKWIDRLLHGFMLFIVFNGTVVYETGPIRWAGATGFAVLGWLAVRRLATGRRAEFNSIATNTLQAHDV